MDESLCREDQNTKPRPRVILAEDHEDVLNEMCELLAPEFEIVRTVRDGLELLDAVALARPDVVVSDMNMPGLNGIDAARRIREQRLCDIVILLTVYGDPQIVGNALEAGIKGYVMKPDAGEELILAINSALAGQVYFSQSTGKLTGDRDVLK